MSTIPQAPADWKANLDNEQEFWERWFRTQGGEWPEDYRNRLIPDLPLGDYYRRFIEHLPQARVRILDVGAGPLTLLGKTHPTKRLEIVASDVLAPYYDTLLTKYQISPPVHTIYAEAERLTDVFAPDSFDLVHAQNSIDHTHDPLDAVRQMIAVARPGCYVLLAHYENEAKKEGYRGLHQWDFAVETGDFVIRGRAGACNVSRELAALGTFSARCVDGWVTVEILKTAARVS